MGYLGRADTLNEVCVSDFIVGNDVKDEEMIVDAWYDKTDDLVYLRTKGKAGVTLDNIEEMVEFTLTV